MTTGKFLEVKTLTCAECGQFVEAMHIGARKYRIRCAPSASNPSSDCPQSGKEYEYEQPLIELKPCEEVPS